MQILHIDNKHFISLHYVWTILPVNKYIEVSCSLFTSRAIWSTNSWIMAAAFCTNNIFLTTAQYSKTLQNRVLNYHTKLGHKMHQPECFQVQVTVISRRWCGTRKRDRSCRPHSVTFSAFFFSFISFNPQTGLLHGLKIVANSC